MNYTAMEISQAMERYISTKGWDSSKILIRISAGEEQSRVLKYGSSRMGKSDKDWENLHLFEPNELPRYPLRHDDVLIASTFDDIMEDAKLLDGTLAHKLSIYENPFMTFYDKESMIFLMTENNKEDTRNRGSHWLFKSDKRQALKGIADIISEVSGMPLRDVPLSGRGIPRMEGSPRRFYFALTNLCNRSCELCSCHSDPMRSTHLSIEKFKEIIDCGEFYEAQLEGGEPFVHPKIWEIIDVLLKDPLCVRIVICTNAVLLPWGKRGDDENKIVDGLVEWLKRFESKPFLLKPSVNSHLISRDEKHMEKMVILRKAFEKIQWKEGSALQYNVRRDPTSDDGDRWVTDLMEFHGLSDLSNDFLYQRLGRAEDQEDLVRPYIVPDHVNFELISPDGKMFGFDLVGRADHMKELE